MRNRVVKGREGLMFYIWVLGEVQVGSDRCDNMLSKKAKFIAQMLLGDCFASILDVSLKILLKNSFEMNMESSLD